MTKEKQSLYNEFLRYAKLDHKIGIHSIAKVADVQMHTQEAGLTSIYGGFGNSPRAQTPVVIEERQLNATAMDVFSRLMMERIIFLGQPIYDDVANIIVAQLLFLNSIDKSRQVEMYINSPGGSVSAGLSIYDTMHHVDCKVGTTCTGLAASMGFVLAISGAEGERCSLPNAQFMQHQPMGGARGQASDIEITAAEIIKLKHKLYQIISAKTGRDIEQIYKDADRDHWMTAQQAKDYGCIDEVIDIKDGVDYSSAIPEK